MIIFKYSAILLLIVRFAEHVSSTLEYQAWRHAQRSEYSEHSGFKAQYDYGGAHNVEVRKLPIAVSTPSIKPWER